MGSLGRPPPTVQGVARVGVASTDSVLADGTQQLSVTVAVDSRALAYPLPRRGLVTIGRDPRADFSIDHRSLSRSHAVLKVDSVLTIEDAGSTNGTYIGERALAPGVPCPLRIGDSVHLGSVTMVVYAWSHGGSPDQEFLWSDAAFQARLEYECGRAQRTRDPFCVGRFRLAGSALGASSWAALLAVLGEHRPLVADGEQYATIVHGDESEASALFERLAAALATQAIELEYRIAVHPRSGHSPEALLAASRGLFEPPRHAASTPDGPVIVSEPKMVELYRLARRAAASSVSVLLRGETGSGKEVLAEAIHRASARRDKPLLRLNGAAFSENLLESELFGYEKGAFSGAVQSKPGLLETAHGGTVFLDEVGELPLPVQAKLLRVLEDGQILRVGAVKPRQVDVRFISATHKDLLRESQRGTFRADLFYRLNGLGLNIPPLRQRPSEIEALALHFLARSTLAAGETERPRLSAAALAHLRAYPWPGNVRELRNVIQRAVLLTSGARELGAEDLELPTVADDDPPEAPAKASDATDEAERQKLLRALEQCDGNQSRAARLLGISRSTLIRRLQLHGLRQSKSWNDGD